MSEYFMLSFNAVILRNSKQNKQSYCLCYDSIEINETVNIANQ